MISLRLPARARIDALLDELQTAPYSYAEVGATREALPAHYRVDRYSVVLGSGDAVFDAAKRAIRAWSPFDLPWVRAFSRSEPVPGASVAVVARVLGAWWVNVSRVVYVVDDEHAFGFAYGTLPHHAERGEERFLVERSPESGEVVYHILAFSQPHHVLARLGAPLARATQRRFGAGSLAAMQRGIRPR